VGAAALAARALEGAARDGDSSLVLPAAAALGSVEFSRRRYEAAAAAFGRALLADTTATPELLATIRLGRGAAWQLLNRGEDAEAEYRAALELAHRARAYDIELRALGNLGDLAEHRQDYAAAMARYREAVAMVDTLRGRQRG